LFRRQLAPIHIRNLSRRGRQAQLECLGEVLEDAKPVAKPGPVALIHNDQIKEVRLEMLIELLSVQFLVQVLIVGEVDLPDTVFPLGDQFLVNHQPGGRREGAESAVSLVLKVVSVRQEKDAVVAQDIPLNELPDELKNGERLAGARGHQQQNARDAPGKPQQRFENGQLLVRPDLLPRHLVNVPRRCECRLPPRPINGVAKSAEQVRRRRRHRERLARLRGQVSQDVIVPVRGDGEPHAKPLGVTLSLLDAIGCRFGFRLRLQDGQGQVAEAKQVIQDQFLVRVIHRALGDVDRAGPQRKLAVPCPTGALQRRLDQLAACFVLGTAHVSDTIGLRFRNRDLVAARCI